MHACMHTSYVSPNACMQSSVHCSAAGGYNVHVFCIPMSDVVLQLLQTNEAFTPVQQMAIMCPESLREMRFIKCVIVKDGQQQL